MTVTTPTAPSAPETARCYSQALEIVAAQRSGFFATFCREACFGGVNAL